jgi:hypothetical protein
MEDTDNGSSLKKLEANRRNAQLSTGPKTERGKAHSRRNAFKHGVLSSTLLVSKGLGKEDFDEFDEFLISLDKDLLPVGMLEKMLVEKIAVCWWRQKRALQSETGLIERKWVPDAEFDFHLLTQLGRGIYKRGQNPELGRITGDLRLPLGESLDRILRYETAIQKQLVHAINQLERLQRMRKGENIPAPVSVQLSNDQ